MDSIEEVSDNILSYLLDNATRDTSDSSFMIEGENETNVSTATDNDGMHHATSELDNSLNPLTSPSLQSAFSTKKLEWDSSADVGSLPPGKLNEVKTRLSTLERMALSNSASKLCLDEDEQSLALIAKIDRVLARSKHLSKPSRSSKKKLNKLPTWPSVDSGSNASGDTCADTVIPKAKHQVPLSKHDKAINTESRQSESPSDRGSHKPSRQSSRNPSKPSSHHSVSPIGSAISSQLFVTRSMVGEMDLYASNNPQGSVPVTPTNFNTPADDEPSSSHCRCVSTDYTDSSCPTHTSLSSDRTRRLQREALTGEIQVYRGLKEHLKNLKDYVGQLEQTWKFLDQTKAAALQKRQEKERRSRRTHHQPLRTQPTIPSFPELPSTSSTVCSHTTDERESTLITTPKTSERSFELERLNLHDTDSTDPTTSVAKQHKKSKTKCCAHCSLKNSSSRAKPPSSQRKTRPTEIGIQTSIQRHVVPQREPIAYEISVDFKKPSKDPKEKITLQDALREKRPDFFHDSERRRRAIQEITHMRREGILDSNAIPRLFTYQELRQHTELIYRQLPEANYRNTEQIRKEAAVSNRIKASMYQRKLQSRVLHGQLNLPHSTCL